MTAARPGWHPRARLFATRSPVPRRRKDLSISSVRDREIDVARHAEHAYEQFVSRWQPRGPGKRRTGAANEERR